MQGSDEQPGSRRRAIAAVATLDDPVRGRLHETVRRAGRPLTREEAAEATGISRKLAAFHLEKLVAAGLLTASVEREGPRRVGRSPKVYAPVTRDLSVSVPVRTYDDLASILVDAAVTQPGSANARQARDQAATEAGKRLGEAVDRSATRGRLGAERALTRVEAALDDRGYEPYRPTAGRVRLRNCPFHALAERAPELVCGVNVCFLGGFLDGLGADALEAVLAPAPGECCVEVRSRATAQ